MNRADLRTFWRMVNLADSANKTMHFRSLGDGKMVYTIAQKKYALSFVDEYGVRGTARALEIPRRTIQRWCRASGKPVKRCPAWV
jgi:hypothetical protein